MAQNSPNTIALKVNDQIRTFEAQANAALNPGHLVELMSTGKFRKHGTAAGRALRLFAMEREYTGSDITDAYAQDDTVVALDATAGDEVYAKVAASAAAIVIGDFLESAGDGTLRKAVDLTAAAGTPVTTGIIADVGGSPSQATINNGFATVAAQVSYQTALAIALEAVDNSAGGAEVFIRVKLL